MQPVSENENPPFYAGSCDDQTVQIWLSPLMKNALVLVFTRIRDFYYVYITFNASTFQTVIEQYSSTNLSSNYRQIYADIIMGFLNIKD